jgi:hypothetical protein
MLNYPTLSRNYKSRQNVTIEKAILYLNRIIFSQSIKMKLLLTSSLLLGVALGQGLDDIGHLANDLFKRQNANCLTEAPCMTYASVVSQCASQNGNSLDAGYYSCVCKSAQSSIINSCGECVCGSICSQASVNLYSFDCDGGYTALSDLTGLGSAGGSFTLPTGSFTLGTGALTGGSAASQVSATGAASAGGSGNSSPSPTGTQSSNGASSGASSESSSESSAAASAASGSSSQSSGTASAAATTSTHTNGVSEPVAATGLLAFLSFIGLAVFC